MPIGERFITKEELDILARNLDKRIRAIQVQAFGGFSQLLDLLDTPSTYVGKGEKNVRVKSTEDGIEFGRKIHVSDDAPESGDGEDGDIWLEY